MMHRCGQFFLCLLFFFCVCVSISSAQEQSTEAGFVKLDSQGQEINIQIGAAGGRGGNKHYGITIGNHNRAAGLFGDPAGFQGEGSPT